MKYRSIGLMCIFCCVLWGMPGETARPSRPGQRGVTNPQKTLSPYFFVKGGDPDLELLPLKSTSASVKIAGVIADVTITQEYQNQGKRPIEASYLFPASTRAAVYAMKMTIGDREVKAKIDERQKARQQYETAKKEGKSASLLEQQRPNVFTMNVANILPGDVIRVELKYTELLVSEGGTYEFVYPTVVGPRYSKTPESGTADSSRWVQNPYLHQDQDPSYSFNIDVLLAAGMPIKKIVCNSHEVDIKYQGKETAAITLAAEDTIKGNKDFVLRYSLANNGIESGVLLYPGKEENFFLVMLEPPKRPTPQHIPPREYVFVLDVSGSMNGFPLDTGKELMKALLSSLRPTDYFNILYFSGGSQILSSKSWSATPQNIQRALQMTDTQEGGGGTEILPALKRALALPRTEKISRTMVVITDGFVDVETEVFELIRKSLGQANLFTFGIGTSVNRFLIEGMARAGMGEPFVVLNEGEAAAEAQRFIKYIQAPVLTNIKLQYPGAKVYEVEPASVPDLFAQRPIIVFGKYKGAPSGEIHITGDSGIGQYAAVKRLADVSASATNAALRQLWARHRIATLSDLNQLTSQDRRIKEVTALGLKYSLMTAYTSFIAVDSRVRNAGGQPDSVQPPLPLPEGVSDLAVGDAAQAMASIQGNISTDQFVPGDPEIEIQAPLTTRQVILLFPDGEVKPCSFQPETGKWAASFLVAEDTPDGIYTIQVLIILDSGEQLTRQLHYQVDGTAPKVKVALSASVVEPKGRVEIGVEPLSLGPKLNVTSAEDIGDQTFSARVFQDVKVVEVLLPSGELVELERKPDGTFRRTFTVPDRPGQYLIPVVVRDHARNSLRTELKLQVGP